jgi:hypothetical protein
MVAEDVRGGRAVNDEERSRYINDWIARTHDVLSAESVEELRGLSDHKVPYLDRAQAYMTELARRGSGWRR